MQPQATSPRLEIPTQLLRKMQFHLMVLVMIFLIWKNLASFTCVLYLAGKKTRVSLFLNNKYNKL